MLPAGSDVGSLVSFPATIALALPDLLRDLLSEWFGGDPVSNAKEAIEHHHSPNWPDAREGG